MPADDSWAKIFADYNIARHDFTSAPFFLTSQQIKRACQDFTKTGEKEVRILCKQDTRESRPQVFQEHNLFILPVKNGHYAILQGEGYVDIPQNTAEPINYPSSLPFSPDTSKVGNSEMQHLDYAYAASLIRHFCGDETLVLTIRGRKFTPEFSFCAGAHNNQLTAKSVQTEVDAGYEGQNKVVLVEAKNAAASDATENVIIRQIYYPYRQWSLHTNKPLELLFFEKQGAHYNIWKFVFDDVNHYNSIRLSETARYTIAE